MRILNFIIGGLIGIGALGVSAWHTFHTFDRLGNEPLLLIFGITAAVELNFILALINGIHAKVCGQKPGLGYWVAFGAGVALVEWSNVSAWVSAWDTWEAAEPFLLGSAIPVLIWTSESIISQQIINSNVANIAESIGQEEQETTTTEQPAAIEPEIEQPKPAILMTEQEHDTPEKTSQEANATHLNNQKEKDDTPEEESIWEPVSDPLTFFANEEKSLKLG